MEDKSPKSRNNNPRSKKIESYSQQKDYLDVKNRAITQIKNHRLRRWLEKSKQKALKWKKYLEAFESIERVKRTSGGLNRKIIQRNQNHKECAWSWAHQVTGLEQKIKKANLRR